jgi:hypothetical protein
MSATPNGSVTLAEIIDAARRSRGLLAAETAGYLVLAAADQVVTAPRLVDPRKCRVLVDGGRVIVPSGQHSLPAHAEESLRLLLQQLLEVSHGSTPALSALADASAQGTVPRFVGELESALIPVNRAAASRALARVARESLRARSAATKPDVFAPGARAPLPSDSFGEEPETLPRAVLSDVPSGTSSEIDELLIRAVASTPPPPPRDFNLGGSSFPPARSSSPAARGVDELLANFGVGETRPEDLVAWDRAAPPKGSAPGARSSRAPEPARVAGPPPLPSFRADELPPNPAEAVSRNAATRRLRRESAPSAPPPMLDDHVAVRKPSRIGAALAVLLLGGMLAGALVLLRRKPGSLSGRTPDVVETERRAAAALAASTAARAAMVPCRATVVVSDVPAGAEVLVRSGVAPIDVERVPSGARLEFVATSDGYAPRRAVIPQGATWESVGGKPRFELAIQLERSRAKAGALDAWPPAEPGTAVGGNGSPGNVHVVTTPRGAEVWMVAGGGPETTMGALPCGTGLELLVAGGAQGQPFRRRLRVDGSQLTPEGSTSSVTARVSATP